jgi:ABC-type lipoprotein release transport system permease subunit
MGAVALRARAELRSRLRSWLGLAALVGLLAGLVIAAAAGARRTDSAYSRFLDRQRAADVILDNYPDPGVATVDPAAVERLPQVASSARAAFLFIGVTGALAPADSRLGRDINRLKVLEGRLPARDRVEEMAVGFERARLRRWRIGTTVPMIPLQYAAEARKAGVRNVRLRVVGIVAAPGDFPPLQTGEPSIYLTPAFYRAYSGTPFFSGAAGQAVIARLKRGAADVPAFRAGIDRLTGGKPAAVSDEAQRNENTERSLDLQAGALWLLAGLLALTGMVVLSQALTRQAFLEAGERETLRAIGMTRRQLFAVGLLRALAVGAVGAAVAVGLAVALSPLAPLGDLARKAEPEPGLSVDVAVFAIGAAATILLTALLAAPAAWRAARSGSEHGAAGPAAGSGVAALLARLGAGTPVVTGVRMALEPGRGRSAVPVRTAIVGVTIGVMAFAGALTFGASSTHLLDTPRLYGWNWDLALTNFNSGPDLGRRRAAFAREPAIEEVSIGDLGIPLDVNARRVDGIALEPVRGRLFPPVIEGRAPNSPGEVMLGAKTMRTLDVEIGDTVTVRRPGAGARRMRVVGSGVLASGFSSIARLGQGAVFHARDARRLAPDTPASDAIMRLAPGTDRRALRRRLSKRLGELYVRPLQKPSDIVDFGRVRGLPLILAGLLALIAAATLAHVLVSAVRRRRRDLAVLKTLGFERRQVRTVVLVQSLTYAAAALVVGLPLGAAAGRFAWNVYADRQGITPEVVVPVPALLLAIPVAALVAGALALLPARWAAATQPAAVLRTE